jgi:hypothetical protein
MTKKLGFIVICVIVVLSFPSGTSVQTTGISEDQKQARDIFKELIEINTSSKYGSTKAAEAMAERLKSAGKRQRNLQTFRRVDTAFEI